VIVSQRKYAVLCAVADLPERKNVLGKACGMTFSKRIGRALIRVALD